MISFTQQEKRVLTVLIAVFTCGTLLKIGTQYNPRLNDAFSFIDSDKSYFMININTATKEELVRIPYIGAYTADQIIRYRERQGAFKNLQEIKNVKGIREKNSLHFMRYLKVENE